MARKESRKLVPLDVPYLAPRSAAEARIEEALAVMALVDVVRNSGALAPEYFAQEEVS